MPEFVDGEMEALARNGILVEDQTVGRMLLSGKDGIDLLHRLSTNDLLHLTPGVSARTVLTTEKGRIVDLLRVVPKAKDYLILGSFDREKEVLRWIERFTITEDCTLRSLDAETVVLTITGKDAFATLSRFSAKATVQGTVSEESGIVIISEVLRGCDWIHLLVPNNDRSRVWQELIRAGFTPARNETLEAARILNGIATSPGELSLNFTPYDVGLRDCISYIKGCYIGQEVIARLETYQKTQRELAGFTSRSGSVRPGEELEGENGSIIGVVTSVVADKQGSIGLAVVRHDAAGGGKRAKVLGGDAVVDLHILPMQRELLTRH
jgi:folate-binding protein YgfZ